MRGLDAMHLIGFGVLGIGFGLLAVRAARQEAAEDAERSVVAENAMKRVEAMRADETAPGDDVEKK